MVILQCVVKICAMHNVYISQAGKKDSIHPVKYVYL